MATDYTPLVSGLGSLISGVMTKKLTGQALGGDQEALLRLGQTNPYAAQQVGTLLQTEQNRIDELKAKEAAAASARDAKREQLRGFISRGYEAATDKDAYLSEASRQLSAMGFDDLAAETQGLSAAGASAMGALAGNASQMPGANSAWLQKQEFLRANLTPEQYNQQLQIDSGLRSPERDYAARVVMQNGVPYEYDPNTKTYNRMILDGEAVTPDMVARDAATIRGAEITAENRAKTDVQLENDAAKKAAAREDGLSMWNMFEGNIREAFKGINTGPLAGRALSGTAAHQNAQNAIDQATSQLKEWFRGPGEGTFTEGDQKVLMNMMPTTTMDEAVVNKALNRMRNIIEMKFRSPDKSVRDILAEMRGDTPAPRRGGQGRTQSNSTQSNNSGSFDLEFDPATGEFK